jgi:hypothetical protein
MKGVIAAVLKTFGLLRCVTDSMKKMKSRKEMNEMEEYNSRTVLFNPFTYLKTTIHSIHTHDPKFLHYRANNLGGSEKGEPLLQANALTTSVDNLQISDSNIFLIVAAIPL